MACLIKGQSIACTQKSRAHYLEGPENEKIAVCEVSGFATQNADEALMMIELSAKGTKCKKPLYSAKINPETDRIWTPEEWQQAIEKLEKNLGLTGHPRVVIEHLKKGRIHRHVLWSRFHPDGGAAKNMGNDYAAHQKTQKEIQKAFQLRPMMAKGRDFKVWEVEWAKRYGFDVFKFRDAITADFNKAKNGREFLADLKAKGVLLCRGDKSQFVLILPWGQHKALSSMVYGRPTKAILRRALGDIDITKLPTVQEGKAQVKATLPRIAPKWKAAKSRSRKSARTYSGKGRTGRKRASSTARRGTSATRWRGSPTKTWRPYWLSLTRPVGSGIKTNALAGTLQKNQATSHIISSNQSTAPSIINTTSTTEPNHRSQVEGQNSAAQENENTTNIAGGINPNSGTTGTTFPASPEKLSPQIGTANTTTSISNSPAPHAAAQPVGGIGWMDLFRAAKHAVDERQQSTVPFRPASKTMCREQEIDRQAAEDGKITWAEYFRKWGRGDAPTL